MVTVHFATPTTIHLSWTSSGTVVDNYEVSWKRNTDRMCPEVDISNDTVIYVSTHYAIRGLQENSSYTIIVTAMNAAGSVPSIPVIGVTKEASKDTLLCSTKKR